jgi:ubiquinone/menaquinone biosynthesis C-methylase UbiE
VTRSSTARSSAEGETLLDVGCGEGLIGFGALERGAGEVIFSDVSANLLDLCREAAGELGVLDRCRFVEAAAAELGAIDEDSVDVVATRSVLIYVTRKQAAFDEFARVLRPGGRASVFESINRFALRDADTWAGYDLGPLDGLAESSAPSTRPCTTRLRPDARLRRARPHPIGREGGLLPDSARPRGRDRVDAAARVGRLPQQLG